MSGAGDPHDDRAGRVVPLECPHDCHARRRQRGRAAAHGDAAPARRPSCKRLTPRNNDRLLFDGIPWVARAQDEHDAFAEALRTRGVEVLYLTDLLTETLSDETARDQRDRDRLSPTSTSATPCAATSPGCSATPPPAELTDLPHHRHPQRRGTRRLRAGHLAAAARRLPDRPAAQPAVHPRLLGVGARPGRDHVAGDARAQARDPADRADLPLPPAVRGHPADPRPPLRARRGRRRAAPRAGRHRGRRRRADHAGGGRAAGAAGVRRRGSRTPCWRCRSPRSGRPCTSTRSARWSTPTRW